MLVLVAHLLVRSALILGAGALSCRLFPRLRPTQRHRILLASFVLLLFWPLLASLLPEANLAFAFPARSTGSVTVQQLVVERGAGVPLGSQPSPILLWAAVAFIALTPLLIAHLRLHSLVNRAITCNDPDWITLLFDLATQLKISEPPSLLIHPEAIMPMAAGVWRTAIILPHDCHSWTESRRRVVLLHELAHIARHDLLFQRLARLVTSAWWFQPLSWGALSLLRRESESACDELVIASGIRPSDYAAELLSIAQTFAPTNAGIAMARPDSLQIRLQSILQATNSRPQGFAISISLTCLTAVTLAASAVNLQPLTQPLSLRGQTVKHTLFAGLLASAGLTAATIGGSLSDSNGAAVPNAKAVLYNPDTKTRLEASTSTEGTFVFRSVPAGNYILRVESQGSVTMLQEFEVKQDVDQLGLKLNLPAKKTAASDSSPSPASSQQTRVAGDEAEANLIYKVQPTYPKSAKEAHIQGTVLLEVVISKEGGITQLHTVSSPSDDLTQSAIEAVSQWRYKPVLVNGNPVEVIANVTVNYTLTN